MATVKQRERHQDRRRRHVRGTPTGAAPPAPAAPALVNRMSPGAGAAGISQYPDARPPRQQEQQPTTDGKKLIPRQHESWPVVGIGRL